VHKIDIAHSTLKLYFFLAIYKKIIEARSKKANNSNIYLDSAYN